MPDPDPKPAELNDETLAEWLDEEPHGAFNKIRALVYALRSARQELATLAEAYNHLPELFQKRIAELEQQLAKASEVPDNDAWKAVVAAAYQIPGIDEGARLVNQITTHYKAMRSGRERDRERIAELKKALTVIATGRAEYEEHVKFLGEVLKLKRFPNCEDWDATIARAALGGKDLGGRVKGGA